MASQGRLDLQEAYVFISVRLKQGCGAQTPVHVHSQELWLTASDKQHQDQLRQQESTGVTGCELVYKPGSQIVSCSCYLTQELDLGDKESIISNPSSPLRLPRF